MKTYFWFIVRQNILFLDFLPVIISVFETYPQQFSSTCKKVMISELWPYANQLAQIAKQLAIHK